MHEILGGLYYVLSRDPCSLLAAEFLQEGDSKEGSDESDENTLVFSGEHFRSLTDMEKLKLIAFVCNPRYLGLFYFIIYIDI
jgi:hypothetical protein